MSNTALLTVSGLGKRFGGLQAVADVDLEVRAGEILGVIGPNGAGKSTTFSMISGALPCSTGTLHFDGKPLQGLLHMRWRRAASCVPSSITSPLPACPCART